MVSDDVGPMSMYRDVVEERYGAGEHYAVALQLMTAERTITGTIDAVLREHGLTRPQWSVLTILHLAPSELLPLGRIARALGVHGTTVANAVDRLTDLGLVARSGSQEDRRTVYARTTELGTGRSDAIMRALARERFGLAELDDEELRVLQKVLGSVVHLT
jgi:MarR family transcriptional repressor of emrRAB